MSWFLVIIRIIAAMKFIVVLIINIFTLFN